MAVYAIGDVQGCLDELQRLLDRLHFDPAADRLWFAGDLVNRGPQSLETLRFIRALGGRVVSVLGNHDLHLLAISRYADRLKARDTLLPILEAPDRDELLDWLRQRPLFHHDATLGYSLVHAGLPPQWDLDLAQSCSREVEAVLRDDTHCRDFLAHMYGNQPDTWSAQLTGHDRLRFIVNACTRLRYCTPEGMMEFRHSGPPGSQPPGFLPWFEAPGRASRGLNVLFGHWASLGTVTSPGVHPLDTGCVWGHQLTALRLDTDKPERISIDCPGARRPGQAG
ncbi:symmetrical bis(5'-nucleosyl)-tetraphosphatase [Thiohalobacter thiocyanaticus]|uniref:Bis(5'-nucleosyl)-tetraphosphatase, symmetrical n=1 Tax=Thiohalobacter thiocyanaticus TaxID=585455 RepID=A0A426QKN3_9GAMM|nr:symmetrical bis(5'-nucleosyl)-tetraphosphatase [Thiohalobacter thiocyanaticus]RRQ22323.1 symmetrical bis(5'-nucleosyl)-tetraphosphatase [Thiohalobacter thiocyanaticus]